MGLANQYQIDHLQCQIDDLRGRAERAEGNVEKLITASVAPAIGGGWSYGVVDKTSSGYICCVSEWCATEGEARRLFRLRHGLDATPAGEVNP